MPLSLPDPAPAMNGSTMLHRNIPASGEPLPAIGLGTYRVFDAGASDSAREPLRGVLRTLVEDGGGLVDSSPMYGRAESVVGDLQAELQLRDSLFLATKVWTSGRDAGVRQMQESLRRMRTDKLDLLQIHNLVDWRTHTHTLQQWKQNGRVRYIGITHYHAGAYPDLEKAMRTGSYDFVQLNYSLAERDAEDRLLPLAQELGVAVLVNRPFAQSGLFTRVRAAPLPQSAIELGCTSWAQVFLKYILSQPAVTCVIPATSDPGHLRDNLRAADGRLPDGRDRLRMVEYLHAL
jgi:diketogulonate reductase-like aldo/keto reductase